MRKNTARHWLHAVLDLLPVILIPVFMIYSHRHTIEGSSLTLQREIIKDVNFNQLSNFNYQIVDDYDHRLVPVYNNDDRLNHKIYFDTGIFKPNIQLWLSDTTFTSDWVIPNTDAINRSQNLNTIYIMSKSYFKMRLYPFNNLLTTYGNVSMDIYVYDLTQMFGVGNEPTSVEEFRAIFPNDSYPYTQSEVISVNIGTETTVYDDTDIMSQFTYQMYNAVDKYFNMGNVFNMNNVYQWFNIHIFGGSAPLYIYVVWQIVLYEFVMDLLFLLYGLFMWFIDMCKALIEKPINSIK